MYIHSGIFVGFKNDSVFVIEVRDTEGGNSMDTKKKQMVII